ncbi:hypothetical protein C5C36_15465 [Rathayibacter sp. AY1G1]|uniref:hypothetical protein n=1 Tax=unclassified Rathayibacter TaxID=2609250 RepID=UPI000CE8009B|nr:MULTISPECIES: hypothetical protein [unclassified Rathayibacter]PPF09966.1 hypothetical protein C5B98_13900 [Rathayibacter sp. AY1A5]PPF33103.1 hypothetical protein C5B93_14455 [Rathayibacter sp. AY1A2]PPG37137.1 hypothetical protein C5C30_14085 [Rathayibacter sp. AY2B5]PPG81562.1 hypothetical protein C5C29_15470 [Rathayibacter sp. AY1H2]PPH08238.1 hypothetical protein C5C71_13260 [Rathayibacter sp. AY1C1]
MSVLVALGASCVALGAAGAAIVSVIAARRQGAAERDRFLLTGCWTGVALMAGFVAWDQWDRVIA